MICFRKNSSKKVSSQTAGAITGYMGPYVQPEINYAHRDKHVDAVLDYLKRTSRIKYREMDLRSVCGFLNQLKDQEPLLRKMGVRGLKLFPKSPYFLHFAATVEMSKGPLRCNKKLVRKQLETALSEAQINEESVVQRIKDSLLKLDDIEEVTGGARSAAGPRDSNHSSI